MTEIIQRMIDRAIESGKISSKQKSMILAKAKSLCDDLDEVEIVLDSIPVEEASDQEQQEHGSKNKARKCPHCGASVINTELSCPECGYVFQQEDKNLSGIKNQLTDFQYKAEKMTENKEKQIAIIKSFSLPYTKEGLMQSLQYCVSQCVSLSHNIYNRDLFDAWEAKAMQAYSMLSRFVYEDPKLTDYLSLQNNLLNDAKSSQKKTSMTLTILPGIFILLMMIIIALVEIFGVK